MVAPVNPFGKAELKYPVEWNFRIIAIAAQADKVYDEVGKVMARCKVTKPLEMTSKSKEGTYQTMTFSAEISSHTEMEILDTALKLINGVKVVI